MDNIPDYIIKEARDYEVKLGDDRKRKEVSLFNKYRRTGSKKAFQDLYSSMKPLLIKATRKAAFNSNIPESAHMAYAAQNFMDALRTYNPQKGTLHTHVYGAVELKANRLNYLHQNLGHMPEPRAMRVGLYQNEKQFLTDTLGREPSTAELADRLRWSVKDVANIEKEVHKDLALEEGTEQHAMYQSDKTEELLDFVYYDISNEQKLVYDYIFGTHGKPKLTKSGGKRVDFDRIARQMGVSTSKVRSLHSKIRSKLERMAR